MADEFMKTDNPNTFWRVLGRFVLYMAIAFSLPILALVVNPWSHLIAQVIFNIWFVALLVVITMRRPPANYDSYSAWWRDRDNWWVSYSS